MKVKRTIGDKKIPEKTKNATKITQQENDRPKKTQIREKFLARDNPQTTNFVREKSLVGVRTLANDAKISVVQGEVSLEIAQIVPIRNEKNSNKNVNCLVRVSTYNFDRARQKPTPIVRDSKHGNRNGNEHKKPKRLVGILRHCKLLEC